MNTMGKRKMKLLHQKDTRFYSTVIFSLFFLLLMLYLVSANFMVVNFKYNHQYLFYFIAATLKEFIFLFPLLSFLFYLRIKKIDIIDILLLGIISLIGLLTGLKNGASLFAALISMKDYTLLYIFLVFLRYKPLMQIFKKIKLSFIYFAIIGIFLVNFIYTIWMYLNFKGDLNILWFYNYYQNEYYNYIRNGHLRATGFFDTPIQASIFFGFTTVFFLYSIFYSLKKRKVIWLSILYSFFMILSILGIYMTHTRVGLIIISIALIVEFLKKFKNSFSLFLVTILGLVLISFLYIIFFSQDLSAIGRIIQYKNLFNKLIEDKFLLYYGYGFGMVGPKTKNIAADSTIIEAIYNFGLLGAVMYMFLYIRLFRKIHGQLSKLQNQDNKVLFEFSNIFFLSLLYMSFFHSLVGKVVLEIFTIFVGIALSRTQMCGYKERLDKMKRSS